MRRTIGIMGLNAHANKAAKVLLTHSVSIAFHSGVSGKLRGPMISENALTLIVSL